MNKPPTPDKGPPDKTKAWACLISNALVLPGLGSVMGGRRKIGWTQGTMSIGGLCISLAALIKIGLYFFNKEELPDNPTLYIWLVGGFLLFIIAWIWALITSLLMLKNAGEQKS